MALTPQNDNIIQIDNFVEESYPTKSWLVNPDTNSLELSDDTTALMKQAIDIRIRLERFAFEIFTQQAGMQTVDLPGQELGLVVSELKRRIEACLMVDERVTGISNFSYELINKNSILIEFTANTIFGDFNKEVEISI